MSEFSIEEKANAYNLALNKAKTLLSKCKHVSDKASMIYRAEDIESMFPELQKSEEERIKDALIELVKCNERSGYTLLNNVSTSSMIDWIEKQEQSKKTSIWKHWKNGICGNGEGKLVFLIKSGATYSLSSCLSFECDYIELSELENLMLEKQDKINTQNNKPFKIESDKFYFCIKDYFAGGCYRSRKGDIVLAQNGMNMMGLSPKEASEYFIPINPFKEHVVVDWLVKECDQKFSWSKEDEKKRTLLMKILEVNHPHGLFKVNSSETMRTEELVSWLESINYKI